jgi:hypothetical protein
MSKKPEAGVLIALARLLAHGRIRLTFNHHGVTISAENALVILAAVIVVALLT